MKCEEETSAVTLGELKLTVAVYFLFSNDKLPCKARPPYFLIAVSLNTLIIEAFVSTMNNGLSAETTPGKQFNFKSLRLRSQIKLASAAR